jgi:hypothetical protein|tara:strand:- start:1198 stop:1734 length:537 start_codon:yes stop_codon:yes gene_type:complete
MGDSKFHTTKDGRRVRKGLYYYMNRAKKRGTSKPGKGSVTDEALERSAETAKKGMGGMKMMKDKKMYGGKKLMKKGGEKSEFGMLSVKAGIDNNPNATQADRIAGATKGKSKKKMMMGGKGKAKMMEVPMDSPKAKKKGMGGKKMSYMKKGGKKKQSKMMYEMGGFLSEPSVFDLDRD